MLSSGRPNWQRGPAAVADMRDAPAGAVGVRADSGPAGDEGSGEGEGCRLSSEHWQRRIACLQAAKQQLLHSLGYRILLFGV